MSEPLTPEPVNPALLELREWLAAADSRVTALENRVRELERREQPPCIFRRVTL